MYFKTRIVRNAMRSFVYTLKTIFIMHAARRGNAAATTAAAAMGGGRDGDDDDDAAFPDGEGGWGGIDDGAVPAALRATALADAAALGADLVGLDDTSDLSDHDDAYYAETVLTAALQEEDLDPSEEGDSDGALDMAEMHALAHVLADIYDEQDEEDDEEEELAAADADAPPLTAEHSEDWARPLFPGSGLTKSQYMYAMLREKRTAWADP